MSLILYYLKRHLLHVKFHLQKIQFLTLMMIDGDETQNLIYWVYYCGCHVRCFPREEPEFVKLPGIVLRNFKGMIKKENKTEKGGGKCFLVWFCWQYHQYGNYVCDCKKYLDIDVIAQINVWSFILMNNTDSAAYFFPFNR